MVPYSSTRDEIVSILDGLYEQNDTSFKYNPKLINGQAQISFFSDGKNKYIMGSSCQA